MLPPLYLRWMKPCRVRRTAISGGQRRTAADSDESWRRAAFAGDRTHKSIFHFEVVLMNPLRGIALKIISVSIFVVMATCIKAAAVHVPPGETVFFRSLFAVPVILIWLVWQHDLAHGLETKNFMGHFWRGLVGTTAMGLGFTALGLLPLPEVTALGYAAPVLTVVFAAMFLGEQVRAFRLSAVGLGLIGVVIILSPRLTVLSVEAADKM